MPALGFQPSNQPTTNLTFDIIRVVTVGKDMSAQHLEAIHQGPLVVIVKQLIHSQYSTVTSDILKWMSEWMFAMNANKPKACADDKLQLSRQWRSRPSQPFSRSFPLR